MIILSAMLASLLGEMTSAEMGKAVIPEPAAAKKDVKWREYFTFTFDTVYVVRKAAPDVDLEPLRKYLGSIGDSLVISDDDEIFATP